MSRRTNIPGIGRDLHVPEGEVAEYVITAHTQDDKRFTFKTKGGGTVIMSMCPGYAEGIPPVVRHDWNNPETRAKVRDVLNAWSQDREFRSRDWHAQNLGVSPSLVACGCDHHPDRAAPPMRGEYQVAHMIRCRWRREHTKDATGYTMGKSQAGRGGKVRHVG